MTPTVAPPTPIRSAQRGFGVVAAIVVMVMLAAMAAAVARMSSTQQTSSAQDLLSATAFQVANAGTEWGMYQALKGSWQASACSGSSTLDLRASTGFLVTVTCTTSAYVEGQDSSGSNITTRLYVVDAVACNGSTSTCPDNSSSSRPTYIERRRQAVISQANNGL